MRFNKKIYYRKTNKTTSNWVRIKVISDREYFGILTKFSFVYLKVSKAHILGESA